MHLVESEGREKSEGRELEIEQLHALFTFFSKFLHFFLALVEVKTDDLR